MSYAPGQHHPAFQPIVDCMCSPNAYSAYIVIFFFVCAHLVTLKVLTVSVLVCLCVCVLVVRGVADVCAALSVKAVVAACRL